MATGKQIGMLVGVAVAAIAAVVVVTVSSRRVGDAEGPAEAAAPRPACQTSADCPPGNECVAPGLCSQRCDTDRDCPEGRTCGELRVMAPSAEHPATTVMTCVRATPR